MKDGVAASRFSWEYALERGRETVRAWTRSGFSEDEAVKLGMQTMLTWLQPDGAPDWHEGLLKEAKIAAHATHRDEYQRGRMLR